MLGLRMCHATKRLAQEVNWGASDPTAQIIDIAADILAQNDGVGDSPYGFIYDSIDRCFPDTKFYTHDAGL